jgi:hypothetical protein
VSEQKKRQKKSGAMRRFLKNKLSVIGMVVIIIFILIAIFADQLAPYDYAAQDLPSMYLSPCAEHPLGTDNLGRDMLSRIIYGTRISLLIGFSSVGISLLIGTLLPLGDSSRTLSQRFDFVSIGGIGFRLLLDRFKVFFLYRYDTGQYGLAGAGNLIYARLEFSQWLDLCDYGFFLLLDVSEHFITGVLVFLN